MSRVCILMLLVATLSPGQGKTAGQDRWLGTWKLNAAKSKFESGTVPKSRTISFVSVPGGMKVTSDLLDEYGSVHIEFTAPNDGKDVAVRGASPGAMISFRRVDASTFETAQKADGRVTVTTRFVVSPDGKVLTASARGLDPEGVKFTNITVYDKVP